MKKNSSTCQISDIPDCAISESVESFAEFDRSVSQDIVMERGLQHTLAGKLHALSGHGIGESPMSIAPILVILFQH